MKKATLTGIKAFFEAYSVDNQTNEYAEWISDLAAEIDRVTAKANYKSPADIAKAQRSAALYDAIVKLMEEADAPLTVGEIRTAGNFTDSPQKITSVINRLVNDGRLTRTYDKRIARYMLVVEQ